MKFFDFLPSTRLNQLQLLDIALVLALLPHLFTLKLPMLIYMLLGLVFIIAKKNSKTVIMSFMFLGLLAIGLSFFAEYNLSKFSRLLVFISLLISLLTHAVILQRLTRSINFYLLISPALLMILSFFFFNSISMLFYALFTLFVFTLLLLYERMQSSLKNALRINTLLYLFSLPIVLFLFLTFPRISYKNASFGFTQAEVKRTGHDGTMFIDSTSLLIPSSKVVMEVSFEKEVPFEGQLYFRGSTLYVDKGRQWVEGPKSKSPIAPVVNLDNIVNYRVKLYPHQKRWLYMLDIPLLSPKKGFIDRDFIARSSKPVYDTYYYDARSALSFTTAEENEHDLLKALRFDKARDEKTYEALLKVIDPQADDLTKAKQLLGFFSSLNLSYSLKPKEIDLAHPLDSFLFDSKVGYCVHFASSFANSARMIGLPSRIVTGYKADRSNAINNYLFIKASDAHAWVELYIRDNGWVRFEPTSTARRILITDDNILSNSYTNAAFDASRFQKLFKQLNIHYMYTRYMINRWILQYDRFKQITLLKELLSNSLFLLKFAGSVLALTLISIILFIFLQRKKCENRLLCEMEVLLKLLGKEGVTRKQGETMFDFLHRIEKDYTGLDEINEIYHEARYSKKRERGLTQLRAKILSFKKGIKNG